MKRIKPAMKWIVCNDISRTKWFEQKKHIRTETVFVVVVVIFGRRGHFWLNFDCLTVGCIMTRPESITTPTAPVMRCMRCSDWALWRHVATASVKTRKRYFHSCWIVCQPQTTINYYHYYHYYYYYYHFCFVLFLFGFTFSSGVFFHSNLFEKYLFLCRVLFRIVVIFLCCYCELFPGRRILFDPVGIVFYNSRKILSFFLSDFENLFNGYFRVT